MTGKVVTDDTVHIVSTHDQTHIVIGTPRGITSHLKERRAVANTISTLVIDLMKLVAKVGDGLVCFF